MTYAGITRSLGALTVIAFLAVATLLMTLLLPAGRRLLREQVAGETRTLLGLAWGAAAVAMGGSLWFSESVGFIPCLLCWYQRIAMYPLVLILGVATFLADGRVWRYVLPLAGVGFLISTYHALIQLRPALDVGTCSAAAPCTARHLALLGFISIPVMAGAAFLLIGALMLVLREGERAPAS